MKIARFFLAVLLTAFCIFAAQISLSGTITDSETSTPIANAKVTLKNQSQVSATTGADGKYLLTGETVSVSNVGLQAGRAVSRLITVNATRIQVRSPDGSAPMYAHLYAFNGACMFAQSNIGKTDKSVSFELSGAPDGMYLARLTIGSDVSYVRLLKAKNSVRMYSAVNSRGSMGEGLRKSAAEEIDVLIVSASGYTTKQVPVSSYEGTMDVALSKGSVAGRVTSGLLALYTFKEGTGTVVNDVSGTGTPLNLDIKSNTKDEVAWIDGGGLRFQATPNSRFFEVHMDAEVSSAGAAGKIISACKASNMLTVEVWCKPKMVGGKFDAGPARMASISESSGSRNVTFSIQRNTYDIRLKTTKTNNNGLPAIRNSDGTLVKEDFQHVVYTFSNPGAKLYIDGKEVKTTYADGSLPTPLPGDFSTWKDSMKLILGNEADHERAYVGDLYLVAYYDRPLSADDVAANYAAGY